MSWVVLGIGVLAVTAAVANCVILIIHARALLRVLALDALLTKLCAEAFLQRHTPIFHAWAQVMGDIEVEVHPKRRWPTADGAAR